VNYNLRITMKKLFLLIFPVLTGLSSSHIHAAEEKPWTAANITGGIGSGVSLAFWAAKAAKYTGKVAVVRGGSIVILGLDIIPRLILDTACIGTSVRGDKNLTFLSTGINTLCCLGSACSLALWAPAIIANYSNPLFIARGVIDALQIILTGRRVWLYSKQKAS
jgi:hypothetical protein